MGFISKIIGDLPFPKIFKFEETRDPLKYDLLLAKNLNNPTSSLQANILFLRRTINNILQDLDVAWDDKWEEHDRIFKQYQGDVTAEFNQLYAQLTEELEKLRAELKKAEENLRAELEKLRGELKQTEDNLRAEIRRTEESLKVELKKVKEALSKVAITVKTTKVTSNRVCVLERVQANSVITIRGYIRSLTGNYSSQNLVITPYIKPLYASGSLDTREITSNSEGPIITYPCLSNVTYIQHSFVKDTGSENVMISFTSTSSLELNLEILWAQNTVIN